MPFFLFFAAICVSSTGAFCPQVKCLQGTRPVYKPGHFFGTAQVMDSTGLLVKYTDGWKWAAGPTVVKAQYCVLAYTKNCQISAYGWIEGVTVGKLPAHSGTCQIIREVGGHGRIFCVCNDADNCHLNFKHCTRKAELLGAHHCPILDRPSHIPQKSPCAGASGVVPAVHIKKKKPDAASDLCVWTGLVAISGVFLIGDILL